MGSSKDCFKRLIFRLQAKNSRGHGVHSPYIFNFISHVFNPKCNYYVFENLKLKHRNRTLKILFRAAAFLNWPVYICSQENNEDASILNQMFEESGIKTVSKIVKRCFVIILGGDFIFPEDFDIAEVVIADSSNKVVQEQSKFSPVIIETYDIRFYFINLQVTPGYYKVAGN